MKHKTNESENKFPVEMDERAASIWDWHDLRVGDHFIEDTYNEVYEVVETGMYDPCCWVGKKGVKPPQCCGVKAVVVGYQVGDKVPPPRETQEPELFNHDLGGPYSGQPYYRVK